MGEAGWGAAKPREPPPHNGRQHETMYPTLIRIGPLGIHTYGLMMALGFLSALFVIRLEFRRRGIEPELASRVAFWAIIGGLGGAKLYYIASSGGSWRDLLSGSGLAWYGGLIGGTACVLVVLYLDRRIQIRDARGSRVRRRLGDGADAIGPAALLGQAFGRMGCFLSGDGCYGPPTDAPWGIAFPNGTVPSIVDGQTITVHPTMLYHMVLLGSGFALLWSLRRRFEARPGALFGLSIILLGIERFTNEFWRLTDVFSFTSTPMGWESRHLADHVRGTAWDGRLVLEGLSEYQLWSVVAVAAGAVVLARAVKVSRRRAASGKDSEPRAA